MSSSQTGLVVAVFLASAVEFVEAFTVVLAMGLTRGWRSTFWGAATAIGALAAVTAVAGYALVDTVPETALQLAIGTLLLIFGLQWLRKAILRSAGLKALHDEEESFRKKRNAAQLAGDQQKLGLDWFGFVVSFKAVFLEGLEVVFIVITFGLNADSIPLAATGAAAACAVVLTVGAVVHRPLARVPENAIKFAVGLLLATFGTFWAVEGLGIFTESQESLAWPGGDWSILGLLVLWSGVSYITVAALPRAVPQPVAEGV